MLVYLYPANSVIGGAVEEREVVHIGARKVLFNKVDDNGYIGARRSSVYFTESQAIKAKKYDEEHDGE